MPVRFWNERYAADEYVYGKSPNLFFKEEIDKLKPGNLLTLAEGEGRNGVYAAVNGWQVTAVDYSDEGRKKALKLAEENNVSLTYYLSSIEGFDFSTNHFDAVSLIYAHFKPEVRSLIHRNAMKSLRKEGRLFIEAFNKKQINRETGGPKNIDMLYDMDELRNDFDDSKIIHAEELTTHIQEGKYHSGVADIIRFIVEK